VLQILWSDVFGEDEETFLGGFGEFRDHHALFEGAEVVVFAQAFRLVHERDVWF